MPVTQENPIEKYQKNVEKFISHGAILTMSARHASLRTDTRFSGTTSVFSGPTVVTRIARHPLLRSRKENLQWTLKQRSLSKREIR